MIFSEPSVLIQFTTLSIIAIYEVVSKGGRTNSFTMCGDKIDGNQQNYFSCID